MSDLSIPRGISRHEYGRARGWLVRVYRTEDGQQKCARRLFSDGVHGGELEALEAAITWHGEQQESLAPRARKRHPGYGYVQRGRRSYRTASGEVRSYDAFVALFWDETGRLNSTSYGVEAHGEDGAEARCQAWLDGERSALSWRTGEPELAQAG